MTRLDPRALLDCWFGHLEGGLADAAHRSRWFTPDAAFDEELRTRFADWVDAAQQGRLREWLSNARGRLAFIILNDQVTRNIHRGTARAFAGDALAIAAAREGVELRLDLSLGYDERAFFYMPFEHSESPLDQHAAVGLFTRLRDDSPQETRDLTGGWLRYAEGHRDIVLRFGRFPHRNAVLGRASTPEETTFLVGASNFGQSVPAT